MKEFTRLLFIITFFSWTVFVSGQSYVGVLAGLNSSKLAGDAPPKGKYKGLMGANVGAYFDLNLGKGIFLSLQPSYSQEGAKVSYKLSNYQEPVDSIKIRLNYFSLPLLLKVTSTNERFYAIGGFEAGMLVDSYVSSNDVKEEVKSDIREYNIAMHFGAGIHIPVGYPRLFFELRYTQGIVNLTNEPIEESYIPRVSTAGLKILVGIEIPLKKSKTNAS